MYCPKCGVEYRPGFTQCSDCLVPLTAEKPRPIRERVTILESDDPRVIASAENLLEEAGIRFEIHPVETGEDGGSVASFISRACRVEVPLDCEDEARALLQSIEIGDQADDAGEPEAPPDPDLELVTVFESNDTLLITSVKSVLKKAGIPFYVFGEELGPRYAPLGSFMWPWCRIQVAADRAARARELVQSFRM